MTNKTRIFACVIGASLLAGCTMAPWYKRPDMPVSEHIGSGDTAPDKEQAFSAVTWKEFFTSKPLQEVIHIALENNRDLRMAALNIDAAKALYRIERSDILPAINAEAKGSRTHITQAQSTTGSEYTTSTYQANIATTAFELDLFGKLRSQNKAALEEFFASEENKNAVQVLLIAQTADAYLQWMADKKILKLVEETLDAQQKSYDLIEKSYENGVASRLDLAQVKTALETARVNKALYTRNAEQDKNALILLMGIKHDAFNEAPESLDDITIEYTLPEGLPSEVLLRRPDIKKAEHVLQSANADIGAARAAFFPSISLTGSYGFASSNLSDLFTNSAAGGWGFAPAVTLPLFKTGFNIANLQYSNTQKKIAVANYEKAIQTAFKEVSDELIAQKTLKDELEAQHQLVLATQEAYDLSYARYKKGIDSFLNVLDAQRSLFNAQQKEVEVEKLLLSNRVNLYKALGGGVK
jgi:multidrug efflux system outer membrane protein